MRKETCYSHNFDSIIPESLSGDFKEAFKLRIGDWRVVYTIENDVISIHAVGHRREIYKKG